MMQPFKVTRDGTVSHRESGAMIGRVALDYSAGWLAYDAAGRRIDRPHWNGKKYAARVVWEASRFYEPPPTYLHPG